MKTYRLFLVAAFALFFITPIVQAVGYSSFSVDCLGYRYDIKRILDGFDVRVTKDGKTRNFFLSDIYEFSRSTSNPIPKCEGAKLPFIDSSYGKYSSSHFLGLINPETPEITIEKQVLQGSTSFGYPNANSNIIRVLNSIQQSPQVISIGGGALLLSNPVTQTSIAYIQNGIKQTAVAPVLKPLSTDGLLAATSTPTGYQYADSYYQVYYFDGSAVLVNEYKKLGSPGAHLCVADNPNTCRASLNKWYRYTNGSWQETSAPVFDETPNSNLEWDGIEIVSKNQTYEGTNNLNDRSYYMYDSSNRVIRYVSPSNWNTTIGLQKITCGDTSYAVFEKQFADRYADNSKLNYPARQYMLEIKRSSGIKAIPFAHDGKRSWTSQAVGIRGCIQNHLLVETSYSYVRPDGAFESKYQTTVVNATDSSVQSRNTTRTSNGSGWTKVDNSNSYAWGTTASIYKSSQNGEVSGDTTIHAIANDGRFQSVKPPFFKRLADSPGGSSMTFSLDKSGAIMVSHFELLSSLTYQQKYYRYDGSMYREITASDYENRSSRYEAGPPAGTSLYLQKDGSRIALKSYFLERSQGIKTSLLHDFGSTNARLNWYRIGPLEKNGTRNIRYSVTVNGKTQTWNAIVR